MAIIHAHGPEKMIHGPEGGYALMYLFLISDRYVWVTSYYIYYISSGACSEITSRIGYTNGKIVIKSNNVLCNSNYNLHCKYHAKHDDFPQVECSRKYNLHCM